MKSFLNSLTVMLYRFVVLVSCTLSIRFIQIILRRPTERGGQQGRRPGAHEFRGPISQTRKKTRVYLKQGKQNKMCAFVNM